MFLKESSGESHLIKHPLNNVFFCDEINRIVVLDKTLEDPLDSKIKLVNPRGNQR